MVMPEEGIHFSRFLALGASSEDERAAKLELMQARALEPLIGPDRRELHGEFAT
jgi:hypothetical protein